MNQVVLIGRITKDIVVRYTNNDKAVANFSIAINGNNRTDYPEVVVFGSQAENLGKYCHKGSLVGVSGRLETGSYEKDGKKLYTTKVVADRVEFLSWDKKEEY